MSVEKVELASHLKKRRLALKMTQSQLARVLGTTQQHISLIERGVIEPRHSTLDRILAALGLAMTVQPAAGSPQDWLSRLESFGRFNAWEKPAAPTRPEEALRHAGDLAELYFRLHGAPPCEPLESQARAWKAWRSRLARCAA